MPGAADGRRGLSTWLLPALVPATLLGAGAWSRRWVSEDGFITFRVAQQLLEGNGPVFNAGERVETATSPLWLGVVTVAEALGRAFGSLSPEWLVALFGIGLAVVALVLAQRGAFQLHRSTGHGGTTLPLGAVVVAVLPPFWDFASSGLESALGFAWLAAVFAVLATRVSDASARAADRPWWLPVIIGLGPLVRPDFALYSIGFLAAHLVISRDRRWTALARTLLLAGVLPVLVQVVRMGYYAALVPNTALAKEAFAANWSQGIRYGLDVLLPYWLVVPLGVAVAALVRLSSALWRQHQRRALALVLALGVCALAHALYVTRLGGDFMHARMLLPALFVGLLPVSVTVSRNRLHALGVGIVVLWAVVCASMLRVDYVIGPQGIADERANYVEAAGHPAPVTLEDYANLDWVRMGALADERARSRQSDQLILTLPALEGDGPIYEARSPSHAGLIVVHGNIGLFGYRAGTHVHIHDPMGLADPLAARLQVDRRTRPGHEKQLPAAWAVARFGGDRLIQVHEDRPTDADIAAARRALACAPMVELLEAVTAPLTAQRFTSNLGASFSLHHMRFTGDPETAISQLC